MAIAIAFSSKTATAQCTGDGFAVCCDLTSITSAIDYYNVLEIQRSTRVGRRNVYDFADKTPLENWDCEPVEVQATRVYTVGATEAYSMQTTVSARTFPRARAGVRCWRQARSWL
ncbi:MAG: hypothetical protein D6692_07185 [Planctomycetota bacterium]|nr:MAG: hypothetical protein D6692_07185 [Planctomycetota bacterium]